MKSLSTFGLLAGLCLIDDASSSLRLDGEERALIARMADISNWPETELYEWYDSVLFRILVLIEVDQADKAQELIDVFLRADSECILRIRGILLEYPLFQKSILKALFAMGIINED